MIERFEFLLKRIGERLWVKPLMMCFVSVIAAFVAKSADYFPILQAVPEISQDSIETLLSIISSSMLVIATFSVASMVSAYASASGSATPRTFPLVIADDVSQNALSTFIGAFIFSIVALITLMNDFYDKAGRFALFALTLVVFALVIFTFVRWVDRIARLGRMGATIDKVETAARVALMKRKKKPTLGGLRRTDGLTVEEGIPVFSDRIGYVQRIDMSSLQTWAKNADLHVVIDALPGTFVTPDRPLAFVHGSSLDSPEYDTQPVEKTFVMGDDRIFDEDPRFGLVVLAEIASRALSPAVNDPGTAIDILGTLVRLFTMWAEPATADGPEEVMFDRVEVSELSVQDMFDDAFTSIARDGAGSIEVAIRLQKSLISLSRSGNDQMAKVAEAHSRLALERSKSAMHLPEDLEKLRQLVTAWS